jgi:hypothetical protein
MQNALICFNDTPPPGVSLPFVNNAASCAANESSNPLLANSYYTNRTNFGMFTVRFKPIKRLTLNLGGSITNVDGTTPQFNILQPLGSLQYLYYYQPVASFSVDLTPGLAWNSGWNYYQYNEVLCRTSRPSLLPRQHRDRVAAVLLLMLCCDGTGGMAILATIKPAVTPTKAIRTNVQPI